MINIYLSVLETAEDKAEFEDLYTKYRQKMYAAAYKILHNVEDAEDAVHNAFIAIADNFEKVKLIPCHKIEAYVVIIVRNTSINIYNHNKKSAERLSELDDNQVAVEMDFFENIDMEELIRIISALPLMYKDILFLHYRDEYTYEEIADMLKISNGAVRKRIERAKKLLKEELERNK